MYDIDDLDNRDPRQIARLAGWIDRLAAPYHRAEVRGTDRVPDGAALYVGNHNGGAYSIDTFLFGAAMYRARGMAAVPYGLGHEIAISLPGLNELLVPLGAVRASHENALRLFDGGHIDFGRTGNEAACDEDWVRECASRVETKMQTALTRLSRGLA